MNVRYGTTEDASLLSDLGAKTFYETFAKFNTPENLNLYLKESFSPEIQHNELAAPDAVFMIAELEGIPVGYAQLIIRAISFYKKWGFREVRNHVFTVGNDPQNDFILELELI